MALNLVEILYSCVFFFQAEDGIRDLIVTGVQTCALPIFLKDSFFKVAKKDFQPRVGFAWGLNGSGKTVLRAGFGIFNDHILPYSYGNFATGYPPFFSTLSDLRDANTAFSNPIPFPNDPNLTSGTPPPAQFGGY